ncbi:hypothetical protein B5M42_003165 [Paenibacillus athensensis]|uniref:NHL repeat containing protein n=1 Tax=Paenibacillus athensensis TaxID=1967502 RepID=A0A4Y8PWT9_9BACL|nr:hypothetical protein [Paenibacillus athensensis]MCD1257841.1 hypothetical protein [Paenibacillus athensensis]
MTSQSGPSPMDYAVALTGAHPELSSPDPALSAVVVGYINSQSNPLYNLGTSISQQGPATVSGGWATLVQAGTLGTSPVYQYNLSATTLNAAGPLIQGTLQLVKQDNALENKLWAVQAGSSGSYQPVTPPLAGYTWTANQFDAQYGMAIVSLSVNTQTLEVQAVLENVYPAFYSVYVEFLDENGAMLRPDNWTSRLPQNSPLETETMKFAGLLAPTLMIEGMQAGASAITIGFTAPSGTASVRWTFGTLGALGWNAVASPLPWLVSAVLGYAVPWIMKSAGNFTTPDWYNSLTTDVKVLNELMGAAAALTQAQSAQEAIDQLSASIGTLLFGGSLPNLLKKLRNAYDDNALIQAAQGINWPLSGFASTLQTGVVSGIVETLSVPAVFSQTTSMQLIVSSAVQVVPDPRHGAWPLTAVRYELHWQGNGQSRSATDEMQGLWTESPLAADFANVPREACVTAAITVYDSAGAVVGQGTAQGTAAVPLVLTLSEAASTASDGYRPAMQLAYDPQTGYSWQPAASMGTATLANLDCSNVGTHLCQLTGLSLNVADNTLLFGWRASGTQASPCSAGGSSGQQLYRLEAISISSNPGIALNPPSCGFYTFTTLAAGDEASDNLFFDTRTAPFALRDMKLGEAGAFEFPTGRSRGYLTLSTVSDLAVHPAGFAAAVSASANMLQIVQLSDQPVADAAAPGPYAIGGTGTRAGLLQQPVAVEVAPDGGLLVLEAGNRRLQAFDIYGNNYNYFGSSPCLTLRQDASVHYLDLAVDGGGRLYVLSYKGSGAQTSDYSLDVYDADGTLLSTTVNVNAAKIAVDAWNNLYASGYSLVQGAGGDVSPVIGVWTPTATT